MSTHVEHETRTDRTATSGRYVPPYGPLDALLGYVLFYVVVDRVTPTVVAGAGEVFPDVAPSAVGFALASFLWFVFVLTTVDQVRRQLAALGVGSHDQVDPDPATRTPPSEPVTLACLLGAVLGWGVVWLTFDRGLAATVTVVDAMLPFDVGSVMAVDVGVLVVFFVAYSVATWSLDRLVVGGIRWSLAD